MSSFFLLLLVTILDGLDDARKMFKHLITTWWIITPIVVVSLALAYYDVYCK